MDANGKELISEEGSSEADSEIHFPIIACNRGNSRLLSQMGNHKDENVLIFTDKTDLIIIIIIPIMKSKLFWLYLKLLPSNSGEWRKTLTPQQSHRIVMGASEACRYI